MLRLSNPLFRTTYIPQPAPPSNIVPNVALILPLAGQSFSAPATVNLSATATDPDGTIDRVEFYRETTLIATVTDPSPTNYALAANGGIATASSSYASGGYPAMSAINGDRRGVGWGAGTGGWNDNTLNVWGDWLEIDFGVARDIGEIDVFTVQDNYAAPSDPTSVMTFTQHGLTALQIQYWTGAAWADVTGGNITGNNLVWIQRIFTPISTSKIRVVGNGSPTGYSRITELEAWATGTGTTYNAVDVNVSAGTYNYTAKAYDNFTPEGVNTSLPVSVSVTTPPIEPPQPPSGTSNRVLVHESASEGPSWTKANGPLKYFWINPGGDYRDASNTVWGSNHYAAVGIGNTAKHRMTIPSSVNFIALVDRLRLDNTGFYFYGTMNFNISSKENTLGDAPPTLTVIANGVTYTPTLTHDSWMDASDGRCFGGQGDDSDHGLQDNKNRVIMKFNLTAVVGPITSATLALTIQVGAAGTLYANYLDMPLLITDPAIQLGGVEVGLTETYTEEQLADGVTVPAVVFYAKSTPSDMSTKWTSGLAGDFNVLQSNGADGGGPPFNRFVWKTWVEYGVDVLRIGTRNYGSVASPFFAQTLLGLKKFFSPGYDDLYHRTTFMVDADVKLGYIDQGFKLPPSLGNVGIYASPQDDYYHARMEHGGKSLAHPDVYRWFGYDYDADRPISNPDRGREDFTSMSLIAGHIYTCERRVKKNTFTSGVPNSDGIDQIWVDGVKVLNVTNRRWTANDAFKNTFCELTCFHGGPSSPVTDIHYEFGPQMCATQYIGPMKRQYPAWRQGMPVGQFSDIANTNIFEDLVNHTGVSLYDWNSVAFDYVNGRIYSAAHGGHAIGSPASTTDPNAPNGVYGLDLMVAAPAWWTLKATTPPQDIANDQLYYYDNTPTSRHSYYFDHFVPSRNRIVLLGCPVGFGEFIPGAGNVDMFNVATNLWDLNGTWNPQRTAFAPAYQYQFNPIKNTEISCAQDQRNGDIYVAGIQQGEASGQWWRWNASTATFSFLLFRNDLHWHSSGTCIDVIRNKWICARNTNPGNPEPPIYDAPKLISTFNLTTGALEPDRTVTGAAAMGSQPYWNKNTAITHDTDRDKYLMMAGFGRVYEIDPDTCSSTVIIGTDQLPFNGVFNKFAYVSKLRGCFYAPGATHLPGSGIPIALNVKFLPLAT